MDDRKERKNHGCGCTWIASPERFPVEETLEPCGLHAMWARKLAEASAKHIGPLVMAGPWRAGRSLGRTLYVDGKVVGMVDTPELAVQIVAAMNGEAAQPRPMFNHTRFDGPFNPCPECLLLMDREQLLSLIKNVVDGV